MTTQDNIDILDFLSNDDWQGTKRLGNILN